MVSSMAGVLYRLLSPSGSVQPPGEVVGSFNRRLAVEGHQRRHAAGRAGDLRTPPVRADRPDLDDVGSPVNRMFDMYGVHNGQRRATEREER